MVAPVKNVCRIWLKKNSYGFKVLGLLHYTVLSGKARNQRSSGKKPFSVFSFLRTFFCTGYIGVDGN